MNADSKAFSDNTNPFIEHDIPFSSTLPVNGEEEPPDEDSQIQETQNSLVNASIGLFLILFDWMSDLLAAILFFFHGDYFVGTLTLLIVFSGGCIVTFCLNFLIHRKGNKEFKDELSKICVLLPYAMWIPSLLPVFSYGLRLQVAFKLRREINYEEVKKLEKIMEICEQHAITDLLYERCYESFPQAVLQAVFVLEKPFYSSFLDFVPLFCVLLGWVGISLSPFQTAKSVNDFQLNPWIIITCLANKGVTLLAFTLMISFSRRYFGDPHQWNLSLVLATIIPFFILSVLSDLPGLISFELERRLQVNSRIKSNLIDALTVVTVLIPWFCFFFCLFGFLYLDSEVLMLDNVPLERYYIVTPIFLACILLAIPQQGKNKLGMLGHFSPDIIILLYIAILSYNKNIPFDNIGFPFLPRERSQTVIV